VQVISRRCFSARNDTALAALAEGDFAKAEGEFAVLERRFRWVGIPSAVAGFNVALAAP